MKKRKAKDAVIDCLTGWEWETLVASWRYYEHRNTITSAGFPADIIARYWRSGKYSKSVLDRIANQFACVDHGRRGEGDWSDDDSFGGLDAKIWCKFYAFCAAWANNKFATVVMANGKELKTVEAFYCKRTRRWYNRDHYISAPSLEEWCSEEYIESVDGKPYHAKDAAKEAAK